LKPKDARLELCRFLQVVCDCPASRKEGRKEGRQEGRKEGRKEERKEGRKKGRFQIREVKSVQ